MKFLLGLLLFINALIIPVVLIVISNPLLDIIVYPQLHFFSFVLLDGLKNNEERFKYAFSWVRAGFGVYILGNKTHAISPLMEMLFIHMFRPELEPLGPPVNVSS